MKTILYTIFFLFIGTSNIKAQSNEDRAKAYYFEAMNAYNSKDYTKTLEYCQQVQDILGSSNARVEALRVKSYYETKNITKAKEALNNFSKYGADENLSMEIAPYIVKIEEAESIEKRNQELAAKKAEEEKQKKIEANNKKQQMIQTAIAEGGFDKNGLKKVEYEVEWEKYQGFIDSTGKEIIPIDRHYVEYLSYDKEFIQIVKYKENGIYDIQGNVIFPMSENTYFDVRGFSLGLLAVRKNDKWGYINKSGELVIRYKFDYAGTFSGSKKVSKLKKWVYLRNVALVKIGSEVLYINTNGERISF